MFRGLFEHSIDAKGRTSFPSRFRDVLAKSPTSDADDGEKVMITTGIDRCLVVYPTQVWEAFEAKLAGLSQFDPAVVQLKRMYVAPAVECPIDRHGRLLIPPTLRDYAGLQRDLLWAGMVTTIEIWSKDGWAAQASVARQDPRAIASALTELGL